MILGLVLASLVPAQAATIKPSWSSSSQAPSDEAGNYDLWGRLA